MRKYCTAAQRADYKQRNRDFHEQLKDEFYEHYCRNKEVQQEASTSLMEFAN